MVRVGSIEVGIGARDDGFREGLRRASQDIGDFGDRANRINFANFARGITAAAASFSAFSDGVRLAVDGLRELGELSDRVAEQNSAAAALDVDVGSFNALSRGFQTITGDANSARDSLRDLQQAFSEVAAGDNRAIQGFRELGLEAGLLDTALEDIDGALLTVLQRVSELNPVLARSALSKLVGEDASFQILQLAQNLPVLQEALSRPGVIASRQAIAALQDFRLRLLEVGSSVQQGLVQALGASGFLGAVQTLIDSFGSGGLQKFVDGLSFGLNFAAEAAVRAALALNRIPGPAFGGFDTGALEERLRILEQDRANLRYEIRNRPLEPVVQVRDSAGPNPVVSAIQEQTDELVEALRTGIFSQQEVFTAGITREFDRLSGFIDRGRSPEEARFLREILELNQMSGNVSLETIGIQRRVADGIDLLREAGTDVESPYLERIAGSLDTLNQLQTFGAATSQLTIGSQLDQILEEAGIGFAVDVSEGAALVNYSAGLLADALEDFHVDPTDENRARVEGAGRQLNEGIALLQSGLVEVERESAAALREQLNQLISRREREALGLDVDPIETINALYADSAPALDATADELERLIRLLETGRFTEAANEELLRLVDGVLEGASAYDVDALRELVAARRAEAEALRDTSAQIEETSRDWSSLVRFAESAFANFIIEAIEGIDTLGDAFESLVRSIGRALIQQGVSGLTGGLHAGGPAYAGRLYETHGLGSREFFVPAVDGAVRTGLPPSGSSVTFNVGVTVGDVASRSDVEAGVRRALEQAARDINTPGSRMNTSIVSLTGGAA